MKSYWTKVTDVLLRRDTDTQGESFVTTETEIGMMRLQAKECQGLLATTRSWMGQKRILLLSL